MNKISQGSIFYFDKTSENEGLSIFYHTLGQEIKSLDSYLKKDLAKRGVEIYDLFGWLCTHAVFKLLAPGELSTQIEEWPKFVTQERLADFKNALLVKSSFFANKGIYYNENLLDSHFLRILYSISIDNLKNIVAKCDKDYRHLIVSKKQININELLRNNLEADIQIDPLQLADYLSLLGCLLNSKTYDSSLILRRIQFYQGKHNTISPEEQLYIFFYSLLKNEKIPDLEETISKYIAFCKSEPMAGFVQSMLRKLELGYLKEKDFKSSPFAPQLVKGLYKICTVEELGQVLKWLYTRGADASIKPSEPKALSMQCKLWRECGALINGFNIPLILIESYSEASIALDTFFGLNPLAHHQDAINHLLEAFDLTFEKPSAVTALYKSWWCLSRGTPATFAQRLVDYFATDLLKDKGVLNLQRHEFIALVEENFRRECPEVPFDSRRASVMYYRLQALRDKKN